MRQVILGLALLLASVSYATTALPADDMTGPSNEYGQYKGTEMKGQKDECLIVAQNCTVGEDSVMARVDRLQREIDKGTAVYTPEELKNLHDQLNWIYSEGREFSVESN